MKGEYRAIYDRLYNDYIRAKYNRDKEPSRLYEAYRIESTLLQVIQTSIDSVNDGYLRADAKYFLLVNFYELIVKPIVIRHHEGRDIIYNGFLDQDFFDLAIAISDDIIDIVNESKVSKDFNEKNQISGHQIISSIDRMWSRLRTTKFEIWG